MRYLRTYENRYERSIEYKYLDIDNDKKMREYVDTIFNKEIVKYVLNDVNLNDFSHNDYDIFTIYDEYVTNETNVFQKVYLLLSAEYTPSVANSLSDYLNELYNNWAGDLIRDRFIELLDEYIKKYGTEMLDEYKELVKEPDEKIINHFSWYFDSKDLGMI